MRLLFDAPVIAVVGVAKNSGKTTTLNFLIEEARQSGRVVGLVSVGVDGEARDALLGTPKPAVPVRVGEFVATTRQMVQRSTAQVEFLEPLGFTTPLGEAVILRVVGDGEILLGGMRHRADIQAAVAAMRRLGAEQVFIDGAYGRVGAADPAVCDGVVIATGAVVSSRVKQIAEVTAQLATRLTVPRTEVDWQRELLQRAIADERVLLGGPSIAPIAFAQRSALLALGQERDAWAPTVEAIAVPGLVSDRVALELLGRRERGALLVRDGTCLQLDAKIARRLSKKWAVRALDSCELLAVSYNPTSLQGHVVRDDVLAQTLRAQFPIITVFNPLVGLH